MTARLDAVTEDWVRTGRSRARIVCFGEVLGRLSTQGRQELAFADALDLHIGGAEANVAAGLGWLGHDVSLVTALPTGALGDRALVHLRGRGVRCDRILRGAGRLGLYFVASGASSRPSAIVYDRAASVFASTDWSTFDWDSVLTGADLLHVSGISLAIGDAASAGALAAMTAARRLGVLVSFDGNYRPQLWRDRDEDPVEPIRAALMLSDLFFGDHRDAGLVLRASFTPDTAVDALFEAFPRLRLILSTQRVVHSVDRHALAATIHSRREAVAAKPRMIENVVDRIGSGDAFATGALDALLTGETLVAVADIGLTLACLKHSQPGDAVAISRKRLVEHNAGSLDVDR